MARKAKTAPNNAKMYRHFAAVTILLTAAVAVMADGNSRRTVEDAVDQHQKEQALQEANAEMFGTGRLIDNSKSDQVQGEFGDDSWVGGIEAGYDSSTYSSEAAPDLPPWVRLGLSREAYEQLPEEEQARLLAQLTRSQPDPQTMNRIAARSLERSGRSEPSDDAP